MPQDSSSEDEDTEDGIESHSLASVTSEGRTENQLEVLEDIRFLLEEDQECAVDTVKVSNCNSYFMCNRDNPLPKPISFIHPYNQAYKNNLQNGESVEKEKGKEELIGGDLVEMVVGTEKKRQRLEQQTRGEDLVEMVESMGLNLVPTENLKNKELSISARKNGRERELQNLKFSVNFKDSEFKRATFNSK